MTTPAAIQRLSERTDELIADHERRTRATDFRAYDGRPVAFASDVLHTQLYDKQVEALEAFEVSKYSAVRGFHGAGKDALLSVAALYSMYVKRSLVLIISATERQLLGQTMREIGNRFTAKLPGKLYSSFLEVGGQRRLICMTSNSSSNLTGWHDPHGVVILISESQAEAVEEHAFDAAIANAVDDHSRVLVVGNPIKPAGRFFDCFSKPQWAKLRISAFDHPNIRENRIVIPGGPSPSWPDEVAAEYGRESAYYTSRVLGEFPVGLSIDGLIRREWLEMAAEKFEARTLRPSSDHRLVLGLDVARYGADASALAVVDGHAVREIVTWRGKSIVETCDLTIQHAERVQAADWFERRPDIVCDVVGLGAGAADILKQRGWHVHEFNAAAKASDDVRFVNLRTESHWHLRTLLEAGRIALPRDGELWEEALAAEWQLDTKGRIQLLSKDSMRSALGRSPDRCDAVTMALAHSTGGIKRPTVAFFDVDIY